MPSSSEDNDYPLNCVSTIGDGFSGWFAISNPRECNDFCFWNRGDDGDDGGGEGRYTAQNTADPHRTTVIRNGGEDDEGSASYWTCVYDAADDDFSHTHADERAERWIASWWRFDSPPASSNFASTSDGNRHSNVPFNHLRCQKGAGEVLQTATGEAMKSSTFWGVWIALVAVLYAAEAGVLVARYLTWKRRRTSAANGEGIGSHTYTRTDTGESDGAAGAGEGDESSSVIELTEEDKEGFVVVDHAVLSGDDEDARLSPPLPRRDEAASSAAASSAAAGRDSPSSARAEVCTASRGWRAALRLPRSFAENPHIAAATAPSERKAPCLRRALPIFAAACVNTLLALGVTLSYLSLAEIRSDGPPPPDGRARWTPACTDPEKVCGAGDTDVDRPSGRWPPPTETGGGGGGMRSFSYLLASDPQLYWYNGEHSNLGMTDIPSDCDPSDSCGRCTAKMGYASNLRMKRAFESLMMGEVDGFGGGKGKGGGSNDGGGGDDTEDPDADADAERRPVPKTLVMNGDLTAYFHPHEKQAYDSIFRELRGLEHYFPSLGNHDLEHGGGATYGGDQWPPGPHNCNAAHALGYFRSGFCGAVPHFQATERVVRYDASSLAYSWEEGRYHFVHLHYYPTYEMASLGYRSSMAWLERDLTLAKEAGLTTVLFVHHAGGLNPAMSFILGKNVVAIVAGHEHRCFGRRCEGVYPLDEEQAKDPSLYSGVGKCLPAAFDECRILDGMNLFFVRDMSEDVSFPKAKLFNRKRTDQPLCPKPPPKFINETDNSLLCRRAVYSRPDFPFERKSDSSGSELTTETIPIFWSGSSSFETFLRADFYEDRIVFNAMTTAAEENEGVVRYIDAHENVPNARYPFHVPSDLEEVVVFV